MSDARMLKGVPESDVAALLHLVARGTDIADVGETARVKWGWDPARVEAAELEAGTHVKLLSGRLKDSAEEILRRNPTAGDPQAAAPAVPAPAPLLDTAAKRRFLRALLDGNERYRLPFRQGELAIPTLPSDAPSEDLAVALQIMVLDSLLTIEERLDRLEQRR